MGVMLIYGAFRPAARPLILIVAGLSKVAFITLILVAGQQFLSQQAGVAVASDIIQVALFAGYLAARRSTRGVSAEASLRRPAE